MGEREKNNNKKKKNKIGKKEEETVDILHRAALSNCQTCPYCFLKLSFLLF